MIQWVEKNMKKLVPGDASQTGKQEAVRATVIQDSATTTNFLSLSTTQY